MAADGFVLKASFVFCTTKRPLGSPFLIKLALSILLDEFPKYAFCSLTRRTDVFTFTEVVSRIRNAGISEALVEISSILRTFTFSFLTPAVAATLSMYLSSTVKKAFLDSGNITEIRTVSNFEQNAKLLLPKYPASRH